MLPIWFLDGLSQAWTVEREHGEDLLVGLVINDHSRRDRIGRVDHPRGGVAASAPAHRTAALALLERLPALRRG